MEKTMQKITVESLYKIFGPRPRNALRMLREGRSKEEILEKTRHTVGVADVSFTVEPGEVVVIMGLSGSGKSTMVRCINRLIQPTAGKVLVDGTDITTLSRQELLNFRRTKFGMVFQHFALFPHKSVLQNVEFGLEIQKADRSLRREKALEALDLVGLGEWAASYPQELSGGMQQRVGLARALALDPDILLMDEAFSALDPLIRRGMQDELISLQERVKKTIIFITHDLDEALKLGDKIILMKNGEVVQQGSGEDILTNPATDYVRRFVEDVDVTKVLSAGTVMRTPRAVGFHTDGPRMLLRKMDEEDLNSLFVLDREHRFKGLAIADEVARLVRTNGKPVDAVIDSEVSTVSPDTSLQDVIANLAAYPYPIAVIDENRRLVGEIGRGTLLRALAQGAESTESPQ